MGFFDKIKKAGSDFMKGADIDAKVRQSTVLDEEELAFFTEKHPNTTIEAFKKEWDDSQTLKKHNTHKIGASGGTLKFITDEKGFYYFSSTKELTGERYYLVGFEWAGPQYNVTSTTVTTGKDKQHGKKASTLGGAALGTILMPGVGTVIGAMAGSSGKKKTDINRTSETVSTQEEKDTDAYLIFVEKDDKRVKRERITCNTSVAKEINALHFTSEAVALGSNQKITSTPTHSEPQKVSSSADELRKFKGLLDDGIITQEEFDVKKKEILGI